MTSAAEKNMLYWLAKNYCDGSGHIVDAGCFMGASTLALAAGATENSAWPKSRKIIAIDNFETTDGMVRLHPVQFKNKRAGDSFFDIFTEIVSPVSEMVSCEPSDFLTTKSLPAPIEILFIDIAKTMDLNRQIVRHGFQNLIPGHSLVIQQDYIYELCPWIIATMEYFADRFEIIDFAFGSSFLFRFTGPTITADEIVEFETLDLASMIPLHLHALERVLSALETIADGTIAELPKNIIKQVMGLSYVELVRAAHGREQAAKVFDTLLVNGLGQSHMIGRINQMAARVGASSISEA